MMNKIPYDIFESTEKEVEYIDNQIFEFNKTRVPFTQKETPILINYVIKNKDEIIADINTCMYHWKILFVYVLFVKENHRHEKLGSFLL